VNSKDKGKVSNRKSVDSKEIQVLLQSLQSLEPKCQVDGIRVGSDKFHSKGEFIHNIDSCL